MTAAEALSGDRDESLKFLAWIESWYRDLLVYTASRDERDLVNIDLVRQVREACAEADLEAILAAFAQAAGAVARVQRNLNRRMVLEQVLIGAVEAAHA